MAHGGSRDRDDEQERKLFIAGLHKTDTDEEVLKKHFESFGNIVDSTIMRGRNGESRGFGFLIFEDTSAVDDIMAAKKQGKQVTIDGCRVVVKRALPEVEGGGASLRISRDVDRKVFVGGLPSCVTEDDLRKYFESYGRVDEVEMARDRDTGRSRRFAFVTFGDGDCADKCVQRRTHEICKKVCEVKRAQPRNNNNNNNNFTNKNNKNKNSERGMRHNTDQPSAGSSSEKLSMEDVNYLMQQAFAAGQQSSQQYRTPAAPPPTTTTTPSTAALLAQALMGQSQPATNNNNNNINAIAQANYRHNTTYDDDNNNNNNNNNNYTNLLHALLKQNVPPLDEAPAATTATANADSLLQLVSLLQGLGIESNSHSG